MKVSVITTVALFTTSAVLSSTVSAVSWKPGNQNTMWDSNCDFTGQDFASVVTADTKCGDACAANSRCSHFTWYQGTCWLKSGSTHAVGYLKNAACGYINGRFNVGGGQTIDNGLADWETNEMLNRINAFRAQNGRGPVTIDSRLMAASKDHSNDQASRCRMDHGGSDGSKPWDRARRHGYPSNMVWENVAYGADQVSSVMDLWWRSQGHHDNIIESSVTAVGFARVKSNCGTYWTQMFGRS